MGGGSITALTCLRLLAIASLLSSPAFSQCSLDGRQRRLVVTSGGREAIERFVQLAGGASANIVFIPTAASSLKSDSGVIWDPDTTSENREIFQKELLKEFGLTRITVLHTRDRRIADSQQFVAPVQHAHGVWISGGNAGRLAAAYLRTRTQKELEALLARGGVIGGQSAGAIIQGSYTVRGRPDKPVLMVRGRDRGFAFLDDVAINPHLSAQKRENELVSVVDRYPKLLGIGLDDDTGLVVKGDVGEVFGRGRVAIYDNRKHTDGWYYWMRPGDRIDLCGRKPIAGNN
jgi:cyanophycinase